MASRTRRKKVDSSAFWSDRLPRVVNACLLLCVLFNFLALAWGINSYNPKEVHHVDSVVTNHFFVVTQYVASVSQSLPGFGSSGSSRDAVGQEIPVKYHYMVVDGFPMIRYFGRNFRVGDVTSYGRIKSIFPDRVCLDGPVYLRNTDNPDDAKPKTEFIKHE